MSKSKPITHPLTSQFQYQYMLGPIKIKDGLFIGDEFAAKNSFILNKVTHVINTVSRKIPNIWEKIGVQYLCFNWTEADTNIFDKKNNILNSIFEFIQQTMDVGQCCLIHSVNSKSRSFLVVAAYLMKKYSWSLDKVFSFVNSKKPGIQIRGAFMKQIKQLQQRMIKTHTFSNGWEDAKTEEDLILKNTYVNSFPIQYSQIYKPGKYSNKKIQWQLSEAKSIRGREDKKKNLYENIKQTRKEEQPKKSSALKSILKFSQKYIEDKQNKPEEPKNIINNVNGNIFHVTVNNFITADNDIKTTSKNPLITRPLSSDVKDKKKDTFGKEKNLGFEGFFNLKSPYQSRQPGQKPKRIGFGSRVGMNDTFKRSSDTFKQSFDRPFSAVNSDKRKQKSDVHSSIKEMVVTNKPFVSGRYPSPMLKTNNPTISQLRQKWKRNI